MWSRTGVVVGHRGTRLKEGPAENTMAAFERAIRDGADAVELDVRLCRTGELVVFHDPDVKRATGNTDVREVRRLSYVELASMHLFGGAQGAPVLRDVLAFAADRGIGVNVEMKHDFVDVRRLVRAVVRELDRVPACDVIVSSFDPRILARVRARRRRTKLALLTTSERVWSLPLARAIALSRWFHAIHIERTQATARIITELKSRGGRVGIWTVNDPTEAHALYDLGADWIITDDPLAVSLGSPRARA